MTELWWAKYYAGSSVLYALYFIHLFSPQAVKEAMTIVNTTKTKVVSFDRYLRMRLILKNLKYAEQTVLT